MTYNEYLALEEAFEAQMNRLTILASIDGAINNPTTGKGGAMSLATKYRAFRLSKNERVLRNAGVLDPETGVDTQAGQDLLWNILFETYQDQLVAEIERQKAEEAANCKTACKK